jgi:CDP-paratose 2-epimerase
MKVLISGVCGFVGSALARELLESDPAIEIAGFDNFARPGSEVNRAPLQRLGVKLFHADVRSPSDLDQISAVDWIIDAAANPSVLAGTGGSASSRQLMEHNLYGTVNLLEVARRCRAGCILLSTSRVYSIAALATLKMQEVDGAFGPDYTTDWPAGLSTDGVSESFSTAPPLSLYGSSKLASEILALEYGGAFDVPVWVNRCGVLAGAGQFGRADQGIFAFWINAYLRRQPLKFIGFGGRGLQTRDVLHPRDLVGLLKKQMRETPGNKPQVVNLSGGHASARSLAQLSSWCKDRFGEHRIGADAAPRQFDLPWVVLDSALASNAWDWRPQISAEQIFEEIAAHAELHPHWLEISTSR